MLPARCAALSHPRAHAYFLASQEPPILLPSLPRQVDAALNLSPASLEPLLGTTLAPLACAGARLALAAALVAGVPQLVDAFRRALWRCLFFSELRVRS